MTSPSSPSPYVVVTPARDEAAHIEQVARAMAAQTVSPLRWVVVDDDSGDATARIARRCARYLPFMRLVRRQGGRDRARHFGHKATAFQAGARTVAELPYRFIGNLDADITVGPDYFERLLARFADDPLLGLAGGMVESRIGQRFVSQRVAFDSVAGAVQMFRRDCFEDIGGYLPLDEGGIDAAAEIIARMKGWRVRTFSDLAALEHRRTGSAAARPLAAKLREGRRLQSLGYDLPFFLLRCGFRALERPWVLGSAAMLAGYLGRALATRPAALPPEVVRFLRAEQRAKIAALTRRPHVRDLRNP